MFLLFDAEKILNSEIVRIIFFNLFIKIFHRITFPNDKQLRGRLKSDAVIDFTVNREKRTIKQGANKSQAYRIAPRGSTTKSNFR